MVKTRAQRGRITKELETAAKKADVKKLVEKPGAVLLPGESSSTRSTSRLHPKKLNDGKRLDARRFRDHFAAKLIGSKNLNTAEGMDYGVSSRPRSQIAAKVVVACSLTVLCMFMLRQSSSGPGAEMFSKHDGVMHVLVTGGAGFIGSHAVLRLLEENYRVTIVDNLSRGNLGAVQALQNLFPEPDRLQFIYADLGDSKAVNHIFASNAVDAVMHFAAVAYVGESMQEPLRYYKNITINTLILLEAMKKHAVKKLIYSSTCATYGEPKTMPITEETPQDPINPYGKAKKMSEDIIKDYAKTTDLAVTILRYFNVIGSDPEGRLGEAPRPELRHHGRISGACFDAAMHIIPGLQVKGTDYETKDGTCVRDYIHVTDLVDAHVKALEKLRPSKVSIYNVGTGKGKSVKEFVDACKAATGVNVTVVIWSPSPPASQENTN